MTNGAPSAVAEKLSGAKPARQNLLVRYLSRFDDGEVLRWAFRGLLVGAIGVLVLDLRELAQEDRRFSPGTAAAPGIEEPVLPPAVRDEGEGEATTDPREAVTADEATLRRPIRFTLEPGGVLSAAGSIDAGASARFSEEISARGEYVRTVSLNSPGGSLDDAIAIARLIREKNIATDVADGAICASSCPLILAGGAVRRAGEKAAVGLHQFYAATVDSVGPAQAMSDAQATTARITRHLAEMGVDPALWLHALETPPRRLYYLSKKELAAYRLTTAGPAVAKKAED